MEVTEDEPELEWHVKALTDDDCDQVGIFPIDKVGPSEVYRDLQCLPRMRPSDNLLPMKKGRVDRG